MRQLPLKNRPSLKIILPLTAIVKTSVYYDFQFLKDNFPKEFKTLHEIESILNSPCFSELIETSNNEFTLETRGKDWADNAGTGLSVRKYGVKDLLKLLNSDSSLNFSPDYSICDLLAGNGYVNQVANCVLEPGKQPIFINSDISFFMFKDCLKQGLFSVWQDAENLFWLKSNTIDAVLLAYGSHHISNRLQAVKEAVRILKPGGRFVLHDFEENSSMADWFQNVVSNYSKTRHDYPHFSKDEMLSLAEKAGLHDIRIQYIEDPFTMVADTEKKAISKLAEYVIQLYGLSKINGDTILNFLNKYFYIRSRKNDDHTFEVKVIRNALVCTGTK